jgi:photosystem II stability/assembly factor-like uncharacterized protein
MRHVRRIAVRCLAASVVVIVLAFSLCAQTLDQNTLKGMKWRLVGPFRGGRVLTVAGIASDPNTYYFGAVAGGVWKTTNGGLSWSPLFDKEPVSSIGSIAVAPSDPNVIYAGTGEACIRGDISYGDGVYKSLDAGKTWTHAGLEDTRHIGKVIVDPRHPEIVFVAALGHAFGPNEERGVFRSQDGGKTWQRVLYKDDKTGAIDVAFDPTNANILYAAMYEAGRTPWSLTSGGPGSGLYKSSDGGITWTQLQGHGLPKGLLGKIGLAVSPTNPSRVYALIEAEEGGLYRSDDAGESWQKINDDHRFRQRAWYFTHIFADPASDSGVYILNTTMYRSTDGGKSFQAVPGTHSDRHDLWIDPANPSRMIEGDDGGAAITTDGGRKWTAEDNQPTAQFYHVAADNQFLYRLYGAQQDSSSVSIGSRSDDGAIGVRDWYSVGGGESGFVIPDPQNSNVIYADSYDGRITRYDKSNGQEQDISAWPLNPMGYPAAELKHRFQWTSPIAISGNDPAVIYQGAEVLFKTSDGGMAWSIVSPDLTRNDKNKQGSSGGPITQDNTSAEYYDTIFSIAVSPVDSGLIWVGSDDGLVHVTRDGGKTWSNATPKGLPEWSKVSLIDASPHDAGTAYLAIDRHALDDFRPYIYKTVDYGKTWTSITAGLRATDYVHAVREDPARKGLLFAGTETGVYTSFDDGGHWQSLQLELPTVPVYDLIVHGNDLILATHGRGFWVLDDVSPLRQLNSSVEAEEIHLYAPGVAYRFRGGSSEIPKGRSLGANPPGGAIIDYSFKAEPKDAVTLEILDGGGKVIRKYSSKAKKEEKVGPDEDSESSQKNEQVPAAVGLNRFVWDLRYEPASKVPGIATWSGSPVGPLAVPGKYELRLIAEGKTYTAPIEVKEDPRIQVSLEDLQKQFDLALKISDRVAVAHDAVNQIRGLRSQLAALKKRLGADSKYGEIVAAADKLSAEITATEEAIIQPKSKSGEDPLNYPVRLADQMMALGHTVDSADAAPTQASYAVFEDLDAKIEEQVAKWKQVREKDLGELNARIRSADIPAISVAPAERSDSQ